MAYESNEIIGFMKIFHELESVAKDFLYLSAWGMKYKDKIKESAKKTLKAIEEYKKLPEEVRKELEKDKNTYSSRIRELEKACKRYT